MRCARSRSRARRSRATRALPRSHGAAPGRRRRWCASGIRSRARWWSTTWSTGRWCSRTPSSTISSSRAPTARRPTTSAWWWTTWTWAITHVIRGDDHLNNTPRQMNMLLALGATPPVYAHLPMILGPDGAKLSKRHGAVSVLQYEEEGYLPEALLNYLVRLGWSHGDQEVFTREEMVAAVRHQRCQQGGLGVQSREAALAQSAAHDAGAAGGASCRTCARSCAGSACESDDQRLLEGVILAQRERAKTLKEMAQNSRVLLHRQRRRSIRRRLPSIWPAAACRCSPRSASGSARCRSGAPRPSTARSTSWRPACRAGLGKIAQPLRVAVTGTAVSPPIDATLALLGRERALARIDAGADKPLRVLDSPAGLTYLRRPQAPHVLRGCVIAALRGAIAQLGERLHGMQEVGGSIPPGSTILHRAFRTAAAGSALRQNDRPLAQQQHPVAVFHQRLASKLS